MEDENKKINENELELDENKEIVLDENNEEEKEVKDDSVTISKSKVVLVKKLLSNIKENSDKLSNILSSFVSEEDEALIGLGQAADENFESSESEPGEGKIIEGVFDGENMIGPDGKQYSVPANYASKSKMVEGDILKLTITAKGTFVYKQISPIERIRVIGVLDKSPEGNFTVNSEGRKWRVLTASVTYFKGESGDETVVLIPRTGECKWAAVENIVRNVN